MVRAVADHAPTDTMTDMTDRPAGRDRTGGADAPDPTDPPDAPVDTGEPGERRARLERPPGERYTSRRPTTAESATRLDAALLPIAVVLGGVILFVVLGALLLVTSGLVVLSLVLGWLVGRLVSPPVRAALVGVGVVALGFLAIWLFGRVEGGVLDPITYLIEVEGPGVLILSLLFGGGLAAAASS